MSNAIAELVKLEALMGALKKARKVPSDQLRPTRLAMECVAQAFQVSERPMPDRLKEAARAILAAQRSSAGLASLPRRIVRDAVWLLWPNAPDGINRRELRRFILSRIAFEPSLLRRLIEAWINQFDGEDESFAEAAKAIDNVLAAGASGLLSPWADAHRTFGIFDAVNGPERLASRILDDPSGDMLKGYRLDAPTRAVSGYVGAAHSALSKKLSTLLRGDGALGVFQRAARFYAPDGKLRFGEDRGRHGDMADGLVGAWIGTSRPPSERLRTEVLAFLRLHLGDPRVERQSNWERASDETRQLVRTWLSALSLEAFFETIGRFAGSSGMGHHWPARKAFWKACLDEGHISDSWLVLGRDVVRAVADDEEVRGSYGRLLDGDGKQSVLLIQIGPIVFAEWTYNGSLRAWKTGTANAPRLFRKSYAALDVKNACLSFPPPVSKPALDRSGTSGVRHDPHGNWEGRVAALLRKEAGVTLDARHRRVR